MNDSLKKDDEKFRDLIAKQHPTFKSFADSRESEEDVIENDDDKMDNLLCLQSLNGEELKYNSIEEKYEDELLIEEFLKKTLFKEDDEA